MPILIAAEGLNNQQLTVLFLLLATLLLTARALGEISRRLGLPTILGEISAGVLLGPTVLGRVAPGWFNYLLPSEGPLPSVLDGFTSVAIALFLLVAGMDVELSRIWRQSKTAVAVAAAGLICPFALGLTAGLTIPHSLGRPDNVAPFVFAMVLATAAAITALPVIAKILIDLDLYRTDLGMVVIAAAIINDVIGWVVMAAILSFSGVVGAHQMGMAATIGMTLVFIIGSLTVARWIIHWILPWIHAYLSWPGGVIGFTLGLTLLGAACTQAIGIHAVFGAFMVGVALGDSHHLRQQTRQTIDHFISFFFAPLFFAGIGLRVDFIGEFNPLIVAVVLIIPVAGKAVGCSLAARWTGMDRKHAWATGFGMTAAGSMGIILGLLALKAHLIDRQLFVALVVMALVTSLASGPIMARILRRPGVRRFADFLVARAFISDLQAVDRFQAIDTMINAVCKAVDLDCATVKAAVIQRERAMPTGLACGVAVPHARLRQINAPIIAAALAPEGIDFEAQDEHNARLIFLILTPADDQNAQLDILADIARTFHDQARVRKVADARNHTEFLAILRSELHHSHNT